MKRTAFAALVALAIALPAAAETAITIRVPAQLSDPAAVEAFQNDVARAIRVVCRNDAGPVLGFNIYAIRKCIADTTDEVAARDTTGHLSAELLRERAYQLASK